MKPPDADFMSPTYALIREPLNLLDGSREWLKAVHRRHQAASGAVGSALVLGATPWLTLHCASIYEQTVAADMVQKEVRLDPSRVTPEEVLEMATLGGARCAGLQDKIGSLQTGKRADIVLFDTRVAEWQPLYNPIYNLVCSASSHSVSALLVDGRFVVRQGQLVTLDEEALIDEVRRDSPAVLERAGLAAFATSPWPVQYASDEAR